MTSFVNMKQLNFLETCEALVEYKKSESLSFPTNLIPLLLTNSSSITVSRLQHLIFTDKIVHIDKREQRLLLNSEISEKMIWRCYIRNSTHVFCIKTENYMESEPFKHHQSDTAEIWFLEPKRIDFSPKFEKFAKQERLKRILKISISVSDDVDALFCCEISEYINADYNFADKYQKSKKSTESLDKNRCCSEKSSKSTTSNAKNSLLSTKNIDKLGANEEHTISSENQMYCNKVNDGLTILPDQFSIDGSTAASNIEIQDNFESSQTSNNLTPVSKTKRRSIKPGKSLAEAQKSAKYNLLSLNKFFIRKIEKQCEPEIDPSLRFQPLQRTYDFEFKFCDKTFQRLFTVRKKPYISLDGEKSQRCTFVYFHDQIRPPKCGIFPKAGNPFSYKPITKFFVDYDLDSDENWVYGDGESLSSTDTESEESIEDESMKDWVEDDEYLSRSKRVRLQPEIDFSVPKFYFFKEFNQKNLQLPIIRQKEVPIHLQTLFINEYKIKKNKDAFIKEFGLKYMIKNSVLQKYAKNNYT